MQFISPIQKGSILGLNYGAHDSSIVVLSPDGTVAWAISLERLSRVKQDGRFPKELLKQIDWGKIENVAISTQKTIVNPDSHASVLHPARLPNTRTSDPEHGAPFYEYLDEIPCELEFVCHYLSHASSAFWPSGFEEATCLVYDGGMYNSPWFGGLYQASRKDGISPLDRFSGREYAKITILYMFITAMLGFKPAKHEGKITGLAALGKYSKTCEIVLERLFSSDYFAMESLFEWGFLYSDNLSPLLLVDEKKRLEFSQALAPFSKEDIASTLQKFTENHILLILEKARERGWLSENICLAGGLFANVKLNQAIKKFGFKRIYIAPPMADDGTAWGAALEVCRQHSHSFSPKRQQSMYLGPSFSEEQIEDELKKQKAKFEKIDNPELTIAALLAQGKIVALCNNRMEFGPRGLGNRSVLAQATDVLINQTLNEKFRRTEFMPFAPIVREEDIYDCFLDIEGAEHAAEFMTIACDCKAELMSEAAAVVHVDGTARPQVVTSQANPFLHQVLSEYKRITGVRLLINTSYNMHEEPIVCTPNDAIRSFFDSGIDYLFLGPNFLLNQSVNIEGAINHFRCKENKSYRSLEQSSIVALLYDKFYIYKEEAQKQAEAFRQETLKRVEAQNKLEDCRKSLSSQASKEGLK